MSALVLILTVFNNCLEWLVCIKTGCQIKAAEIFSGVCTSGPSACDEYLEPECVDSLSPIGVKNCGYNSAQTGNRVTSHPNDAYLEALI